jgi:predicted AlkP superfamily pyrophosphatase or phosphodiesterase
MKVLLILVDGMRPCDLADIPEAQATIKKGASDLNAKTVFPSVTLPCHVSLFHSVDPERHGTTTNCYAPQVRPIAGVCEMLRRAGKNCAMYYNWEELRDLSRPDSLEFSCFVSGHAHGYEAANRMVTDTAIAHITQLKPDFAFLYLGWVDMAGHNFGWGSEPYKHSLAESWKDIVRTMEAVGDEYTVIITADHGGHEYCHGSEMAEDMTIPIIACGENFAPGSTFDRQLNIKDIAPTIVELVGAERAEEWKGESFIQNK